MKTKILIYTHAVDLDGWTSGALVRLMHELAHPYQKDNVEYTIKEWTYSREEPKFEKLIGYDYFYLTDLHFSTKLMAQLFDAYNSKFIWIDHHQKAIDDFYKDWKNVAAENNLYHPVLFNAICADIEGIQSSDFAACGLTWLYFIEKIFKEGNIEALCNIFKEFRWQPLEKSEFIKGPWWLTLIDSYDRWNNSDKEYWDRSVMPFQFFMRTHVNSVDAMLKYIDNFENTPNYDTGLPGYFANPFNAEIQNEILSGSMVLDYQRNLYKSQWKTGYESQLENYKVFVLNTQDRGSIIFENMPGKHKYDLFVPFYFDGINYNYSMYTFRDDIDCAELCSKYLMGGGHRKASGGKSKELFFKKI